MIVSWADVQRNVKLTGFEVELAQGGRSLKVSELECPDAVETFSCAIPVRDLAQKPGLTFTTTLILKGEFETESRPSPKTAQFTATHFIAEQPAPKAEFLMDGTLEVLVPRPEVATQDYQVTLVLVFNEDIFDVGCHQIRCLLSQQ